MKMLQAPTSNYIKEFTHRDAAQFIKQGWKEIPHPNSKSARDCKYYMDVKL